MRASLKSLTLAAATATCWPMFVGPASAETKILECPATTGVKKIFINTGEKSVTVTTLNGFNVTYATASSPTLGLQNMSKIAGIRSTTPNMEKARDAGFQLLANGNAQAQCHQVDTIGSLQSQFRLGANRSLAPWVKEFSLAAWATGIQKVRLQIARAAM